MSTFYEAFERRAGGDGLKAHSTHYCPGCGHGLVHKFIGDAVEALGIQDRAVAISPVGCAVFLYYYLDVGHVQAAHGRAPAVAIGAKLARPDAVVVSYQGDGDLASIGLAEIMQAAAIGIPITVVFVNNAIYGMTGGQMAPTTLIGQKTATSPAGRDRTMGQPLRMAELVAQLDAPVYVERVALFDAKQRVRTQKAIEKALRLQVENKGFAFVEVLSECPLHLGLTPVEAERWVKERMVPVYPLGVKKDVAASAEPWPCATAPSYDAIAIGATLGAAAERSERFCTAFPRARFGPDIAFKLAGAGGDGAQTAAMIIARAAINEGFDATHIPSYGPESRGGTSHADVRVAETEVLSPAAPAPHVLVAFNGPSLAKFGPTVVEGGIVIYDSTVAPTPPVLPGVTVVAVPATDIANGLGRLMMKNMVALGALAEATALFPIETFVAAIRQTLHAKPALLQANLDAFEAGRRAVARRDCCAESQADGVPCTDVHVACAECVRAH